MAKGTRTRKLPAEQLRQPEPAEQEELHEVKIRVSSAAGPIAGTAVADSTPVAEPPAAASVAVDDGPPPPELSTVSIELPAVPLTDGQSVYLGLVPANGRGRSYVDRHVDAQLKDVRQRAALRRLRNALDASGARLANGKRCTTSADCVRWLLEQYAAAIDNAGDSTAPANV